MPQTYSLREIFVLAIYISPQPSINQIKNGNIKIPRWGKYLKISHCQEFETIEHQ